MTDAEDSAPDKREPEEGSHHLIHVDREILAEMLSDAGVSEPDEIIDRVTTSQSVYYREESFYHGPYPQATEIAAYEQAIPGSGDRIFAMAEREQAHRHKMEERTVSDEHEMGRRILFHAACRNYIGQGLAGLSLITTTGIGG